MQAVGQLAKGTQTLAHEVALLRTEVSRLTEANNRLNKQKRAKKTRLRIGGSLTVQQAEDILAQRAVEDQLLEEDRQGSRREGGGSRRVRRCGLCGQISHDRRTCPMDAEMSDSTIEEVIEAQI